MVNSYIKAILDNSPECIVLIGKNHEVLAYNQTIRNVLKQYHQREIEINDFYYPDFVIEANKELYLDTFHKAVKGESVTVQNLTENDNVSIWFEYRMTPIYHDDGSLLGVALSAKDITTSKMYETRLKESEDRFRKISNLAPIGILITNELLEITYANNASCRIFEYDLQELTDRPLSDLIANLVVTNNSEGLSFENLRLGSKTPVFYQERFEGRSKSDKKADVLLSSSSFNSQDKLNYIFVIQDISEAMIKEKLISRQHNKLRDIAWYQAHVIRAPLSNIMGAISVLEDKDTDISLSERSAMHQALIQSARELDKVICNIIKEAD